MWIGRKEGGISHCGKDMWAHPFYNSFPDVEFFRSDQVQEQMTDILFIYCKLNQDVSYRQGMHELLAPIYFVLSMESISTPNDSHSPVE